MLEDEEIDTDIYSQIKTVLEIQEESKEEMLEFLNDLPARLKIKTSMFVFKEPI